MTLGLGPSVFGERFGLARFKPALFSDLPPLNGDLLDPKFTGGDLSLQACADDPQVSYHAFRNLARIGRGVVVPYWTVLGFGRASAGPGQATPRMLLGFKDGTRNIKTDDEMARFVWIDRSDQPWLDGGSYQVVRKIRMLLETWDADRIGDQQQIFGRDKDEGAPLTGTKEFDTPDFAARDAEGELVISPIAHIALSAPENNGGVMIKRRSYNYTDGLAADGSARRRAAVHLLPERSAALHPAAEPAGRVRPAQRVHPAHRLGHLRGSARARGGPLHRRGAVRLTGRLRRAAFCGVSRPCTTRLR